PSSIPPYAAAAQELLSARPVPSSTACSCTWQWHWQRVVRTAIQFHTAHSLPCTLTTSFASEVARQSAFFPRTPALRGRREERRRSRSTVPAQKQISARNQHAGQPCRDRVGRPAGVGLVVDEILARLPVKDVFRCRAVRRSWRSGTSTYAFILGHHRRQPSLPIILHDHGISRVAGASASSGEKIRPLLRYASLDICIRLITCDGLLILWRGSDFYICNPATRKCAPLPHPPRQQFISPMTVVDVLGFYRHQPSGEYRVLWVSYAAPMGTFAAVKVEQPHYLVFTVGSDQPRRIQWPTVSEDGCPAARSNHPPIHHRGSLHWAMGCSITVFDTIAETFRQMSRPAQLGSFVLLLDTGDNLALYVSTDHDRVTLDVWVLQDYDAETWGFRYRINLVAMDASPPLKLWKSIPRLAVINERSTLVLSFHVCHVILNIVLMYVLNNGVSTAIKNCCIVLLSSLSICIVKRMAMLQ
uniref:F-box associated beta-propeller type 3 domain-containing protein n=3 Tax=Aegilops tauschii subsp. strangulata TaxID=200361 RepID=A0A453QLG1_AEGTS